MAGFARTEERPKAAARTQTQYVRNAPVPLDFSLFEYLEGIVNFDPKVAHCTFQLAVTKQQLDSPETLCALIYQSHFGAAH